MKRTVSFLLNLIKKKEKIFLRNFLESENVEIKDELFAKLLTFRKLKSWNVRAPFSGKILKIHKENFLWIENQVGTQAIIEIKKSKNILLPSIKIFKCEVSENQYVRRNQCLFTIFLEQEIEEVGLRILTQEGFEKMKIKKNSFEMEINYPQVESPFRLLKRFFRSLLNY